jgi:hypothetical protein
LSSSAPILEYTSKAIKRPADEDVDEKEEKEKKKKKTSPKLQVGPKPHHT